MIVAVLAVDCAATFDSAAQTRPVGGEFQVNTYTFGAQSLAQAAAFGNGFVVVWDTVQDPDASPSVFAQLFTSSGDAIAVEFQINDLTLGSQQIPDVASSPDGFVVVWEDQNDYTVSARRFGSAGLPDGGDFKVNSHTSNTQRPRIGMRSAGDFVVVWQSYGQDGSANGIFGRRFGPSGDPQGAEFQVNTYTAGQQRAPDVALSADGRFVVVWENAAPLSIVSRRFDAAGAAQGGELTIFTGVSSQPVIGFDASGGLVVAWNALDANILGAFAQRFDSSGVPDGAAFAINQYTLLNQSAPALAVEPDGVFFTAWQSQEQDGDGSGIFARRLVGAGIEQAPELQANVTVAGNQSGPVVAAAGRGNFLVVWSASQNQDGSSTGVFARRMVARSALDVDGDGSVDALTDGLLILRYAFGFRGAVLIAGAIDLANCMRCTAELIEDFLADVDG